MGGWGARRISVMRAGGGGGGGGAGRHKKEGQGRGSAQGPGCLARVGQQAGGRNPPGGPGVITALSAVHTENEHTHTQHGRQRQTGTQACAHAAALLRGPWSLAGASRDGGRNPPGGAGFLTANACTVHVAPDLPERQISLLQPDGTTKVVLPCQLGTTQAGEGCCAHLVGGPGQVLHEDGARAVGGRHVHGRPVGGLLLLGGGLGLLLLTSEG